MAYLKCLGSAPSSGSVTEEVLWENPDDTASFGTTNISLNDNISNYTALRFEYKLQASDNSGTLNSETYPVDRLITYAGDNTCFAGSLLSVISNSWYMRYIKYVDDTTITISQGIRLWSSNTYSQTAAIPVRIVGIV